MRNKVIIMIILGICLVLIVYMVVINSVFNKNEEIISEYVPEVEISDNELRKTIVTLYFVDSEDGSLKSEARLIDSKELLRDPYTALIGMLIEGPKDSKLKTIIPEDTKILNVNLVGNCLTLDLSEEFIKNAPENVNQKSNMIYTIVNTLTELKEIESIKFLINGEETTGFEENALNLTCEFVRKS